MKRHQCRAAVLSRGELFTRHRQRRIDDWISRAKVHARHRREHPHRLKRDDSHGALVHPIFRAHRFLFRHALKAPHLFLFAVRRERPGVRRHPARDRRDESHVKDAFHPFRRRRRRRRRRSSSKTKTNCPANSRSFFFAQNF